MDQLDFRATLLQQSAFRRVEDERKRRECVSALYRARLTIFTQQPPVGDGIGDTISHATVSILISKFELRALQCTSLLPKSDRPYEFAGSFPSRGRGRALESCPFDRCRLTLFGPHTAAPQRSAQEIQASDPHCVDDAHLVGRFAVHWV
jgi:hypothetical protein